jgi:hypothetical protein
MLNVTTAKHKSLTTDKAKKVTDTTSTTRNKTIECLSISNIRGDKKSPLFFYNKFGG